MKGFAAIFEDLDDPCTGNTAHHDFLEIVLIAMCTLLCGGQTAVDMAEFAEVRELFLREFLPLANGMPSHDTFSRIFRLLDPERFFRLFWTLYSALCHRARGYRASTGKLWHNQVAQPSPAVSFSAVK